MESSTISYTMIIHFSSECCVDAVGLCFACPSELTIIHIKSDGTLPAGNRALMRAERLDWCRKLGWVTMSIMLLRARADNPLSWA